MGFIDTHCHFDFEAFSACRDDILATCRASGVESIILPSVRREKWRSCLELGRRFPNVYVAAGLHPYFIADHESSDLNLLQDFIDENKSEIVAVGEIGLDDERGQFERQKSFFEGQLKLAQHFNLPVIMHIRRNHGQGLKLVRQYVLSGGVVHAFSGSKEDAHAWLELGMCIGVGGVITYERAKKTRATIASLPLDALVLETDSPDMAIQGVPKGKGRPWMVKRVFESLCDIRSESPKLIEEALYANSKRLFSL